jgi:MFS superfamily sulfate permease-like transporter
MGARLLDWSTWRRLGKMRLVDAAAFVGTAVAVLMINAVAAIAIGCSFHVLYYVYRRFVPLPFAKEVRRPSAGAP